MKVSTVVASFLTLIALAAGSAHASHLVGHPGDAPMTDAEVRKVDLDAKKITLKHAEITNLGMPAMTMVFRVADVAMLEGVKTGDKVKFSADRVDGAFVVTAIETSR